MRKFRNGNIRKKLLQYIALGIMMSAVLFSTACSRQKEKDSAGEPKEVPVQEEPAVQGESSAQEESGADSAVSADLPMEQLNSKLSWSSSSDTDSRRTFYEIFVWSFCDSNGDGIGDLPGVLSKLDYVNDTDPETKEDLGCSGIWLMPVFPSPTYHKYDVTDYCAVDPAYGTMDDLEKLIAECHARDIRLILDLPVNHTSVEHPWFQEAAAYLRGKGGADSIEQIAGWYAECPSLEFYNFAIGYQQGYEPLEGTNLYYEARFWAGMPDLNLSSEAVRQEIRNIAAFWLEKGVDGFRLDAVTSYYTDDHNANIGFLSWFNSTVKSIRPDAYLVGEAWENEQIYARYYESGIDSLFDFAFAGQDGRIAQTVRGNKSALSFAQDMAEEEKLYASYRADAVNAPFYTNHDMARSTGYYAYDDGSRTKLAGALNLLMTGNAFVYYGEETGLKGSGKDENKRAPMPWTDPGQTGMCAGPPDMDPQQAKFGTVESQMQDPLSVFHYYRNAVRIRNAFPVIARGATTPVEELSGQNTAAFMRTGDGMQPVLIVFSTSEQAQTVDLSAAGGDSQKFRVLSAMLTVTEEPVKPEGNQLVLPPFGIAVLTAE